VEWVDLDRLRELAATGQIGDGLSLTAILHRFVFPPVE
jgi:hypothetical protein